MTQSGPRSRRRGRGKRSSSLMTVPLIKRFKWHGSSLQGMFSLLLKKTRARPQPETRLFNFAREIISSGWMLTTFSHRTRSPDSWQWHRSVRTNADSYLQAGGTLCIGPPAPSFCQHRFGATCRQSSGCCGKWDRTSICKPPLGLLVGN